MFNHASSSKLRQISNNDLKYWHQDLLFIIFLQLKNQNCFYFLKSFYFSFMQLNCFFSTMNQPKKKKNECLINPQKVIHRVNAKRPHRQESSQTFELKQKIVNYEHIRNNEQKDVSFYPKPQLESNHQPAHSLKRPKQNQQYAHKTNQQWLQFKQKIGSSQKIVGQSKLFSKMLKKKQIQQFISNYQSSQETYNFFIDKILQQQAKEDRQKLEKMKVDMYQSPARLKRKYPGRNELDLMKMNDSSQVMEMLDQKIKSQFKSQLINIIEEEKRQNQKKEETFITSLNKKSQRQEKNTPEKQFIIERIASACSRARKSFASGLDKEEKRQNEKKLFEIYTFDQQYGVAKEFQSTEIQTAFEDQEKKQFGVQTQNFRQFNTSTELTDDEEDELEQATLKESNFLNKVKESRAARVARIRQQAGKFHRKKNRTPQNYRLREKKA